MIAKQAWAQSRMTRGAAQQVQALANGVLDPARCTPRLASADRSQYARSCATGTLDQPSRRYFWRDHKGRGRLLVEFGQAFGTSCGLRPDRSLDCIRRDEQHDDPVRALLVRQRLHEAVDGGFAGRVRAEAPRGDISGDRAEHHDLPPTTLAHARKDGLRHPHRPRIVDRHDGEDLLGLDVSDLSARHDAGRVHQQVDRSERDSARCTSSAAYYSAFVTSPVSPRTPS